MRGDTKGARFDRAEEWTAGLTQARKLAAQAVHKLKQSPMCRPADGGLGRAGKARRVKRPRR